MKNKETMINYSDLLFFFRFGADRSCVHRFINPALVYVYAGQLEAGEPGRTVLVQAGEAVFVHKGTYLRMAVCPLDVGEVRIAILRIPESWLREFYFAVDKQDSVHCAPGYSLFLIPHREDVESLFCSMLPYYGTGVAPGEKVLKLKVLEAVYALLETDRMFYPLLFGFAHSGRISVFDLLADTCIPPFYWHNAKEDGLSLTAN